MNETLLDSSSLLGLLLLAIPLAYGGTAILPVRRSRHPADPVWQRGSRAAAVALALSVGSAGVLGWQGPQIVRLALPIPFDGSEPLRLGVRLDVLTTIMLVLVTFIGLVILRYSRRYLDGDHGRVRYVRWLLATLAAVSLLVMANHLALIWLAWFGTSLALHQLLTFYDDRPRALIAAHKKFLSSRIADLCLLAGFTLLARTYGSGELDLIFAQIAGSTGIAPTARVAALLLATAAALKCAQLPFHGWLIQVMEAPTPVSALLHAGVVNIGGFLMVRLAPLMVQAEGAQTLLVALGSATAVLASLVMMTRVSIKVALAWSTCAQMGFMLLECGLGAYSLAMLHLVAHSLYKAHAFLGSGSTVETWRAQALTAPSGKSGTATWLAGGLVSVVVLCGIAFLIDGGPQEDPVLFLLVGIVAAAVTPLVTRSIRGDLLSAAPLIGGSLFLAGSYLIWHEVFALLIKTPTGPTTLLSLRVAIVAVAFGLLFALYVALETRPTGRIARAVYPPLFAGLYLDELFTRLTFRIWPAQLPALPPPPQTLTLRSLPQETPR